MTIRVEVSRSGGFPGAGAEVDFSREGSFCRGGGSPMFYTLNGRYN